MTLVATNEAGICRSKITVDPGALASFALSEITVSLAVGEAVSFTTTDHDRFENLISDAVISWDPDAEDRGSRRRFLEASW